MSPHGSPPKRPRLSLQIKALSTGPSVRTSRALAAVVDPKSPTSFNTLSNVYSTAVDRSTPVVTEPVTAINMFATHPKSQQPQLRLRTHDVTKDRPNTTPYTARLPETPLTAQPLSPPVAMEVMFPSTMTATPPMSAGPVESAATAVFSFSPMDTARLFPNIAPSPSPRTPRRRTTFPTGMAGRSLPYVHPRALHSILRNSPLPPKSTVTPTSPRRQSLRLQEKAARRVGYESPLTQTITTNKYTKSHIDLLFEEASPYSPSPLDNPEKALDLTTAYTGDETRDGGQTPGPFEEMRRRLAGLVTSTPVSAVPGPPSAVSSAGGIRKRKRKDKKRRWVWTIGQEEDDDELGGAMAAVKAAASNPKRQSATVPVLGPPAPPPRASRPPRAAPPLAVDVMAAIAETAPPEIITPSIEHDPDPAFGHSGDIEMSDTCSVVSELTDRAITPGLDMDLDMITPTVTRRMRHGSEPRRRLGSSRLGSERLGSEDLFNPETGNRRDTPIPADLLAAT